MSESHVAFSLLPCGAGIPARGKAMAVLAAGFMARNPGGQECPIHTMLRCQRDAGRCLRATAGGAALAAAIAGAIARHDRAAEAADRRVAHVHDVGKGVGGMDRASFQFRVSSFQRRPVQITDSGRRQTPIGLGTQVLKQQLLLAGQEAHVQPAEDVVHDRLGEADLGVG